MRMFSAISLVTFGLIFGSTLLSPPVANGIATGDVHQPSIMIDQLTANAKNLPVQSFDTF